MTEEELIKYLLATEHEGCYPYTLDGYDFYSLEGKGVVLSCEGTDLQFYVKPEYRRQGLATKYIREIIRNEFKKYNTIDITFENDWFRRAFYDCIPHSDVLTFDTGNGFYLVNARKKGNFIADPYEFKV